jgi:hypothetical protein
MGNVMDIVMVVLQQALRKKNGRLQRPLLVFNSEGHWNADGR